MVRKVLFNEHSISQGGRILAWEYFQSLITPCRISVVLTVTQSLLEWGSAEKISWRYWNLRTLAAHLSLPLSEYPGSRPVCWWLPATSFVAKSFVAKSVSSPSQLMTLSSAVSFRNLRLGAWCTTLSLTRVSCSTIVRCVTVPCVAACFLWR